MNDSHQCEDFKSQEESFQNLNESFQTLDCSPLKKVSSRDKVSYGKRKIDQAHSALKTKYAHALAVSVDSFESSEEDTKCCEGSKDLDILMTLIKDKIMKAENFREKIKLLTLAPNSWSQQKTAKEFGVSIHLVKRARHLKKHKGILTNVAPKKGRRLSEDIVQRIIAHYENDEFTRIFPGKKDCIAVMTDEGKVYKQKRLILNNLKELYLEYIKKYQDDDVGFSKFCQLRPTWCKPVTASGTHSVCVCRIHQNAKLMTAALPGNETYKDILGRMVCSTENRECMLHLCINCPGKNIIQSYLTNLFTISDYEFDYKISFKQWCHTDRSEILTVTMSILEFIDKFCDAFDDLREHHFIAKAQSKYLTNLKENLSPGEVLILLDFAENYSFVIQDAVQGFHWNNAQATLHPFVVYYKDENELKSLSLCVISDCLRHDTTAVHAYISNMLDYLKTNHITLSKVMYFSDGATGQYKNYKNFSNLICHKDDFGVLAEWHFFATSHGKSPCDGIGGTVKRLVARASLQATTTGHILTPRQMFEWASNNIKGIKFLYISTNNVTYNAKRFKLAERFANSITLKGTRSHHCFIMTGNGQLMMKRLSDDVHQTKEFTSVVHNKVNVDELQPGKFVACVYDKKWYIGCILEYCEDQNDVKVDFMKQSEISAIFRWPSESRRDICWVPVQHILCLINALDLQGQRDMSYKLSSEDEKKIAHNFLNFN